MSNEEMACLIKGGHKELMADLWEAVKLFVTMYSNKFYNLRTELCRAADITPEDLVQEGYFALLKALEAYKPEKGYKLLTYMTYSLKNTFYELVGVRANKREALNGAISLHTPTNEGLELMDTIAADTEDMEEADRRLYNDRLHEDLEAALNKLEPIKESIIKEVYYNERTAAEAGRMLNIPASKAAVIKQAALSELRRDKAIRAYRNDIIGRYAYKSSFSAWKDSGYSSTERAAFKLLRSCNL